MVTILEMCEATPQWGEIGGRAQALILERLHAIRDLLPTAGAALAAAMVGARDAEDRFFAAYREFAAGRAAYPGPELSNARVPAPSLMPGYAELRSACLAAGFMPHLQSWGVVRSTDGAPLASGDAIDPASIWCLATDARRFFAHFVPTVVEGMLRSQRDGWEMVKARLADTRAKRRKFQRLGATRREAMDAIRNGLEAAPTFYDSEERKRQRKLPAWLQGKCKACGKLAGVCKCRAYDTCGHFGEVTEHGACKVCRGGKATRILPAPRDAGHVPCTQGNRDNTLTFWGKVPKGRLPLVPRYIGVEIEVARWADDLTTAFWQRLPPMAALVSKWGVGIGTDGSLPSTGREFRLSPARNAEAIGQITETCHAIEAAGGEFTSSCGIHIHVDAADFKRTEQYRSLFRAWDIIEPLLFGKMPERRGNTYCKPTRGKRVRIDERGDMLGRTLAGRGYEDSSWHTDRYHTLNLANLADVDSPRRTVEFRIFKGSKNPTEISTWAHVVSTVVHFAARCDKRVETVEGLRSILRPHAVEYLNLPAPSEV